jgi:hypothetical protein
VLPVVWLIIFFVTATCKLMERERETRREEKEKKKLKKIK